MTMRIQLSNRRKRHQKNFFVMSFEHWTVSITDILRNTPGIQAYYSEIKSGVDNTDQMNRLYSAEVMNMCMSYKLRFFSFSFHAELWAWKSSSKSVSTWNPNKNLIKGFNVWKLQKPFKALSLPVGCINLGTSKTNKKMLHNILRKTLILFKCFSILLLKSCLCR